MPPLLLSDDRLLTRLVQGAEDSDWPQFGVCAHTGRLLWANGAARSWLGLASSASHSGEPALAVLMERLGVAADPDWRLLASGQPRRPLLRRLSPDSQADRTDPGRTLECVCAWLAQGGRAQLVVRVRPLPHDELAFLQSDLPALQAGHAVDGLPEGSGVVRLDRHSGQLRVAFADPGFAQLLGQAGSHGVGVREWEAAGLAPFDALLMLAAVAAGEPALFVLRVQAPGGRLRRWRLGVSPRDCAGEGGSNEACALLSLHPKDRLPTPPRFRGRGEVHERRDDVQLCLNGLAQLLFVDPGWQALLGHEADNVLGRSLLDLLPEPARASCAPLLNEVFSGLAESARHELPFVHADGRLRWLELRLWRDPELAGLYGAALFDISERLQVRRIRSIQTTALDTSVNGVVITDCSEPGDRVVYVNHGFTRMTGYSVEEMLGQNCRILQGPDTDMAAVERLSRAIQAREPITEVLLNYRKDGTPFWNRVEISPIRDPLSGLVTHFFGLQTDVTLSRQAEEAALKRASELEQLFRHSPLGIVATDAQGQLLVVSPAFERLTGLSVEELTGRPLAELRDAARVLSHEAGGASCWPEAGESVTWTLTKPVRRVLELSSAEPERGAAEQLVFVRDVTAERELGSMKTQFLATAAHELRAPMGSIRGFAELLLLREFPREQQREMLDTVLRQSLRMNALLSDLLDLSKLEAQGDQAFALAPVRIGDVAERALKLVLLPGDARQVQQSGLDNAGWVQGNGAKLEQVLINLLSNALKYSPGGGKVALSAQTSAEQPGWLCLAVSDEGLGLSPVHQAQLFTRFFRADPNNGIPGTGLGLVIVKELVERMGGRIEVHSELGQGSSFNVWLRTCEEGTA